MKTTSNASSFVQGAALRARVPRDFENHVPTDPPTKGFTVRLNAFELELLRACTFAEYPRVSQQRLARKILREGLMKIANAK